MQISFVQGENGGLPGPVPGPVSAQVMAQTGLPGLPGLPGAQPQERQPKMSIYERFVARRNSSSRGQNKRSSE